MLVSHRKKFIFIKTAKTAGTSVESYFERFCLPSNCWEQLHYRSEIESDSGMVGARGPNAHKSKLKNHMSAMQIRDVVTPDVWASYFKFSIIRNPFDLIVSRYFFVRNRIEQSPTMHMKKKDVVLDFRKFAFASKPSLYSQLSIDNCLVTDYLIKYEELTKGIREVSQILDCDINLDLLPTFKSGFRDRRFTLQELYNSELISYVEAQHKQDLDVGDYKFPD